jgi:hypothetical protein
LSDLKADVCSRNWRTDLLTLRIYSHLNRVPSSRRPEAETNRNVEVIWLLRHLKPDFKTIVDFRRDSHKAFHPIFGPFTLLCRKLDRFSRKLIAVDGTRIKAINNNKDRNFTRAPLIEFIKLTGPGREDRCGPGIARPLQGHTGVA